MRNVRTVLFVTLIVGSTAVAMAQPPEEPRDGGPRPPARRDDAAAVNEVVSRMMAFDKNKDGKLTRDEVSDSRMERLSTVSTPTTTAW